MKQFIILFALSFFIASSCSKEKDNDPNTETLCFEFDQRQCGTDEWALQVTGLGAPTPWEENMKNYLEGEGLTVSNVAIDYTFHEAVCEACHVCPEQHRFFVEVKSSDSDLLEALELLNLAPVNCDDHF